MNLSILCVTNNEYDVTPFIEKMRSLADLLHAELVLGLDRPKAQKAAFRKLANKSVNLTANTLQEDVMDKALDACKGDYVLRLDDDETVSPVLEDWLSFGEYQGGNLFSFPRLYLYPDANHYLVNEGIVPDLQTRLGKKELMYGFNYIHAGNPNGAGTIIPYAIEHHKLIARTREERQAIADRYETIRKGAGTLSEYARYNLPELFYKDLIVTEYVNRGDMRTY